MVNPLENNMNKPKRIATIGKENWILPFNSNGFWVDDATGKSFAEFRNQEVAKDVAKMLNTQFQYREQK